MELIVSAVMGALATVGAAFATWHIGRLRMSGSVKTTDAERLWAQNEKLLDAYQADNNHLRDRLEKQEQRLWDVTERERQCAERYTQLERKHEQLERMLRVDIKDPDAG